MMRLFCCGSSQPLALSRHSKIAGELPLSVAKRSCSGGDPQAVFGSIHRICLSAHPRNGNVVSCLHCMNDPQPEGHMASYIGRRKFLATLGGAAAAWPVAARAQSSTIHRIGWISLAAPEDAETSPYFEEFRAGLRDLGYVEGRDITVDARWARGEAIAWPLAARAEQWPTDRRQGT
jgi:hypothetical protein